MRTSALPTLVLALLILCGGAFATWYLLSDSGNTVGLPSFAAVEPDSDVPAPAPTPAQPVVRPAEITRPSGNSDATPAEPVAPAKAPKAEAQEEAITPGAPDTADADAGDTARRAAVEDLRRSLGDAFLPIELDPNAPKETFSATFSGTVVDNTGAAVSGATIYAQYGEVMQAGGTGSRITFAMASDPAANRGAAVAVTGPDGSFTYTVTREVRQGSSLMVTLVAGAEPFADSRPERITLRNGDQKDGIRLMLRGQGTVAGRVVDGNGRGIPGVTVQLMTGDSDIGGIRGRVAASYTGGTGPGPSAVTDSSGNFSLAGVAEGRYRPRITAAGWREVSGPREVMVAAGADVRLPADFVLAAASVLQASFAYADGSKPRGPITVHLTDSNGARHSKSGQVDAEGVLELNDVPAGSFSVEMTLWGHKPVTTQAVIVDGQATDLGSFVVERGPSRVGSGIVIPGE